jgi:hypothetical protein
MRESNPSSRDQDLWTGHMYYISGTSIYWISSDLLSVTENCFVVNLQEVDPNEEGEEVFIGLSSNSLVLTSQRSLAAVEWDSRLLR